MGWDMGRPRTRWRVSPSSVEGDGIVGRGFPFPEPGYGTRFVFSTTVAVEVVVHDPSLRRVASTVQVSKFQLTDEPVEPHRFVDEQESDGPVRPWQPVPRNDASDPFVTRFRRLRDAVDASRSPVPIRLERQERSLS